MKSELTDHSMRSRSLALIRIMTEFAESAIETRDDPKLPMVDRLAVVAMRSAMVFTPVAETARELQAIGSFDQAETLLKFCADYSDVVESVISHLQHEVEKNVGR